MLSVVRVGMGAKVSGYSFLKTTPVKSRTLTKLDAIAGMTTARGLNVFVGLIAMKPLTRLLLEPFADLTAP